MLETKHIKEKVVLVGAGKEYGHATDEFTPDMLDELRLLARTAGSEVVGSLVQSRDKIEPAYYIGKGKVQELKDLVEQTAADTVIFDNDLSPGQASNLMKLLEVKVVDRSGLILDIFALRARTREARTQVALAQLNYLLPRLTRQWTHLSRQQGGIGTRGPGETQLETDRRAIRQRIFNLNGVLEKIERQRETARKQRSGQFKVALVGYTNAGKSTLLNALSGAGVPVENLLFKTLDSTTRAVQYEGLPAMLISDTVGFIRNLPHDLIASFMSTLAEVRDADLLLHVTDITNPEWSDQEATVAEVLQGIGVTDRETIMVFNKIDCLEGDTTVQGMQSRYPDALFISADNGIGLDELKHRLAQSVMKSRLTYTLTFYPKDAVLMGQVYRYGTIIDTTSEDGHVRLTFSIPVFMAEKLGLDKKVDCAP